MCKKVHNIKIPFKITWGSHCSKTEGGFVPFSALSAFPGQHVRHICQSNQYE